MSDIREAMNVHAIGEAMAISLEENLRELLESRHLYQSYQVDSSTNKILASVIAETKVLNHPGDKARAESILGKFGECTWDVISPFTGGRKQDKTSFDFLASTFRLTLPTVKLYCSSHACKRIEPYNPYLSRDFSSHIVMDYIVEQDMPEQLFVLEYQCQSCKGTPTVFMIKRKGWKLTIVGRSPI